MINYAVLSNLRIHYTFDQTWNSNFEVSYKSYSYIPDIQYYFEYIIKKHETVTENPPIRIYVNEIENIKCKIKTGFYLELLTPETMKLFGSIKRKVYKDENVENVSHLFPYL